MVRSKQKDRCIWPLEADDSSTDLCPWPWDDAASQQNISTPFIILIEFEATEYSYSIRARNFQDIRFDSNEIPDSSHP